jgi:hypothetical protein
MRKIIPAVWFVIGASLLWAQGGTETQSVSTATVVFMILAAVLVAYIVYREISLRMARYEERRRLSQMEESAKNETQEKNRLIGENKQLIDQAAQAKATLESAQSQLTKAQQTVGKFESERDERAREHQKSIAELENARKALVDEQTRVRREEEERRKKEEEERDRVWAVHEQESLAKMKEVCQKPELGFAFYEANNLPDGFDASVKPDFMIEFLGQYMIFDPKFSKSSNLAVYIKSQVKSSATKYKNSASADLIYKTAFFIVPTVELNTLRQFTYFEQGFTFHVVPSESIEPILCAYRRVANYDLAERFDPQEREDIINLIAVLGQHIRHQNAANVLNTILGVKALQECEGLPQDVSESVEKRRKTMRIPGFKPSDMKRLINSPEEQIRELSRLAAPSRPPVSQEDLREVHEFTLDDEK